VIKRLNGKRRPSWAVFPISMGQTTPSSSAMGGVFPVISDAIVAERAVFAILTVIKPVFGTSVGTYEISGGAIATPIAKMFLENYAIEQFVQSAAISLKKETPRTRNDQAASDER
jgi:hypothetical protein